MKSKNYNLYNIILKEIKNNCNITEKELENKYNYTERTIRRYIKDLKDNNVIKLEKNGKERFWKIL